MSNLEKAVKWAIDIAKDDSHGYDQSNRLGPNYDCSSFVGSALNYGGFNVKKSSTTRTLLNQLLNCGFKIVNDVSRKRGDIYLKVGHHIVMCINDKQIVHASINENGKTSGGKTGDQTGKEICVRNFYTYKGGWDYHLRYTINANTKVSASKYDSWVASVQKLIGAKVDGVWGSETLSKCPMMYRGYTNLPLVKLVQQRLNSVDFHLVVDGIYGSKTKETIKVFQENRNLQVDGIVGKDTWTWLLKGDKM